MTSTEFTPECILGFSEAQLRAELGDHYPVFAERMLMRANPVCTGQSPCAESHGNVVYAHDVQRLLDHTTPPNRDFSHINDPVESRRESMIDILASWDLDGARPDAEAMQIVRDYVDGKIDLAGALTAADRRAEQFRVQERAEREAVQDDDSYDRYIASAPLPYDPDYRRNPPPR